MIIERISYCFKISYFTKLILQDYFADRLIYLCVNLNNLFNSLPDSFAIIFVNRKKKLL